MTWLRRIGPGPVVFVALWLLLLAGGRSRLFRDPGTFWHTRVGEIILADGFFDTDPFTFSRAGERWIPHQWLGEVGLALVHRVAGFDALLLLAATGIAALFTWLTLRLLRTGADLVLAVPLAALGLAAAATHFHVRPHLFTIVALAITTAALTDFDAGRIRLRRLWLLVPLFLVWTNIHGGMLGGFTTLVLCGLGWAVFAAIGWSTPLTGWRAWAAYAAIVAVCGLTAVVTPYGKAVPETWLAIMRLGDLSRYVEEHAPLSPSNPSAWPVLGFAAVYLLVMAGVRGRLRVAWLLPLFWLLQAFERVRHAPLFSVVALIAIADAWPATIWARRLALRRPDLYDPAAPPVERSKWGWAIPVVLVGLALGLQVAGVRMPVIGAGWARHDPGLWPVEALPAIRAAEPASGPPVCIFNECEFGGFLIYHAPGYRVFFDDRFELHGEAMVREFVHATAEQTAERMEEWQSRFGRFDAALVRTGGGFDHYFRGRPEEWEIVHESGTATFYRRRGG